MSVGPHVVFDQRKIKYVRVPFLCLIEVRYRPIDKQMENEFLAVFWRVIDILYLRRLDSHCKVKLFISDGEGYTRSD